MIYLNVKPGQTIYWHYDVASTIKATLRNGYGFYWNSSTSAWQDDEYENPVASRVDGAYRFNLPSDMASGYSYLLKMYDGVVQTELFQITIEDSPIEHQHIAAGSESPLIWDHGMTSLGVPVVATVQRLSDSYYWNESSELWQVSSYNNACTEISSGVYKYVTPNNELAGDYVVTMTDQSAAKKIFQVYAGDNRFTSSLNVCRVYGTLVDSYNNPLTNALVILRGIPVSIEDNIAVSIAPVETYTASDGTFSVELVRDRDYIMVVSSIGFNKHLTIPDAATATLESLNA